MNDAPFVKVEVRGVVFVFLISQATKFTEVGYHGRDVDDIIKDLVATTIKQYKNNLNKELEKKKDEVRIVTSFVICSD